MKTTATVPLCFFNTIHLASNRLDLDVYIDEGSAVAAHSIEAAIIIF
jgi:hypothetical protein